MLVKFKEKVTKNMVGLSLLLNQKVVEEKGEAYSLSAIGWAFLAVAIVLGLYNILPDEATDFIKGVFTKVNTGLGI